VLDSYFELTNKSYLIHRLWYDLIRFVFIILVVAYFFGPPYILTRTESNELLLSFYQFISSYIFRSQYSWVWTLCQQTMHWHCWSGCVRMRKLPAKGCEPHIMSQCWGKDQG